MSLGRLFTTVNRAYRKIFTVRIHRMLLFDWFDINQQQRIHAILLELQKGVSIVWAITPSPINNIVTVGVSDDVSVVY